MVDLLGRAGYLDEAWDFIQTMPDAKSDAPIWELGYEPDMNCVVQNVDDDEKVKLLLGHTEKLAITYGLIKRRSCSSNVPIRVIKNTRTCSDCHSVAKLISLAKGCEIILRDGVRFHHFKDGKCSCNDYW
ncbi:Pentatricopeptide repeat-containing protein At4g01030, mitochondrial [Linum perenne]